MIGLDNEQIGVMPVPEAIRIARESGVDVVEVSPSADPPVCRLMDYGKFRYEQAKKEREAKKTQKSSSLREVRMRTRIGESDMQRKTNKNPRIFDGRGQGQGLGAVQGKRDDAPGDRKPAPW